MSDNESRSVSYSSPPIEYIKPATDETEIPHEELVEEEKFKKLNGKIAELENTVTKMQSQIDVLQMKNNGLNNICENIIRICTDLKIAADGVVYNVTTISNMLTNRTEVIQASIDAALKKSTV